MAPSTLGTFLRAFTFGHVRQLDKVLAEVEDAEPVAVRRPSWTTARAEQTRWIPERRSR
jgi:hypothetical protein